MKLTDLFALAADLGADRHGIVRAEDLRLALADPDTVAQALERHWWAPVRSVYVPHRDPLSDVELGHVGAAHAGPGSVVSGVLGMRIHRLRWVPDVPGVLMLVGADTQRSDSRGLVVVRRNARLHEVPTTEWNGLLLAGPAQVVVDASRQLLTHLASRWGQVPRSRREAFEARCLQDVRGIVLGAVADGRCTTDEIRAVLDVGGRNGSRLIRRACVDADRGAASPPEAEFADGFLACNVPFALNVEVWVGRVLVGVVDALLLGTAVASEIDSEERHGEQSALDLTLVRHGRVERAGLTLGHITPRRYRATPAAHHRELVAMVRLRRERGLGDELALGLRLRLRGPVLCGKGRPAYEVPAWAREAARIGALPERLLPDHMRDA